MTLLDDGPHDGAGSDDDRCPLGLDDAHQELVLETMRRSEAQAQRDREQDAEIARLRADVAAMREFVQSMGAFSGAIAAMAARVSQP